jgi:hypothetical protein
MCRIVVCRFDNACAGGYAWLHHFVPPTATVHVKLLSDIAGRAKELGEGESIGV